jgi:chromosome segregation ATPase
VDKTVNLQDLYNSLIASKELLKVLAHIWGPVELNPSTLSLISALRSELDVARSHVRRLIKERNSDAHAMEGFKKQLSEEMESWKSKQKEKVANALQFIDTEMDNEKKSRKRAERINKKLATALANTEASLQAATKEVERERKSRGRVEKICSELIRGIDEDKAEVEALKRETEKAQEELHKEREMLQLADEWREQRVQMKLLEARLQFEEKNASVNQLRNELQAYLDTKKE